VIPIRHDLRLGINGAWAAGLGEEKLVYKPGDLYMGVDYQMYRMGGPIGHVKASTSPARRWSGTIQLAAPLRAAG